MYKRKTGCTAAYFDPEAILEKMRSFAKQQYNKEGTYYISAFGVVTHTGESKRL